MCPHIFVNCVTDFNESLFALAISHACLSTLANFCNSEATQSHVASGLSIFCLFFHFSLLYFLKVVTYLLYFLKVVTDFLSAFYLSPFSYLLSHGFRHSRGLGGGGHPPFWAGEALFAFLSYLFSSLLSSSLLSPLSSVLFTDFIFSLSQLSFLFHLISSPPIFPLTAPHHGRGPQPPLRIIME